MLEARRLDDSILRRFYKGLDPSTLTPAQTRRLLRHIKVILNLETGKPVQTPEDWFAANTVQVVR